MAEPGFSQLLVSLATLSSADGDERQELDEFFSEGDLARSLQLWFGNRLSRETTREQLRGWLCADLAVIDQWLNELMNEILHHPKLQRLEASWRGLHYLTQQKPAGENVLIRVLSVSWRELSKDAANAIEFDQSQIFQKVYEEEFGMPGGYPYGLILADYEIRHRPSVDHPFDDIDTLQSLAQVGAAAFAPVIGGAHPHLFELESFEDLDRHLDLERAFRQHDYFKTARFRESEDARYVGLTVPRVLMRLPYRHQTSRIDQFPFEEEVRDITNNKYLWGTAVYSFGVVAMRTFAATGWFDEMTGTPRGASAGGLVPDLPIDWFDTEREGVATKITTDARLSDADERNFSSHGFISLCHCKYTHTAAFFSCPSLRRAVQFNSRVATRNEELSTKLNLMLCVSRFAHYLKVIVRDHVGYFIDPNTLEDKLTRWIQQYVSADPSMAAVVRARYPLREADVRVTSVPDMPGNFYCVAHLRPHLQTDYAVASVRLVTELPDRGKWLGGRRLTA